MRTLQIALLVLVAALGAMTLSGCGRRAPAKAAGVISVEQAADRLVSELVLFPACIKGDNLGTVAALAGRLELPLQERLARAWKSNHLLDLFGADSRSFGIINAMAPMFDLMRSMTTDVVSRDEAKLAEFVKSVTPKLRLQSADQSKREPGGNPQLFRERIWPQEKDFNASIDEASARKLLKMEAMYAPRILQPNLPELTKLRGKLVRVLQADPELLATVRELITVERVVPDDVRDSRERADRIIAAARGKK
jgi:hypothetical protein